MSFNFGGATSGAVTGAAAGSSFGPIGTGIGAIFGGVTGGLFGKKKKPKIKSTLDPQQQALYNEYNRGVMGEGGQFANEFNPDYESLNDVFNQNYAQPAYQDYRENIVPGITGAFRGQNLENSSYLGGALANAGRDVQNNLNARRSALVYQAQQDALNRRADAVQRILNMNTQSRENRPPSAIDELLGNLSEHAGRYIANKYMPIPE